MYQALYRKWRPRTFDDVVGQPQVTVTLKNELESGRISHAYLFTGTRGTGKTSCAKILSKAVNCLAPVNGNPCNECEICKSIDSSSILDVIEIDAASNNSVENIRDLREEASYTPVYAKYRVYIIDEVHMLSTSAFNALLKTLEEPPKHVLFILATTELHKLPATILSRCQRFDFKRISPDDISKRLLYIAQQEGVSLTEPAAGLIARLSDGGMRDAVSLFDRCCVDKEKTITQEVVTKASGIAGSEHLFDFSNYIATSDFASALRLVTKLHNEACDSESLCTELALHFRNLMVIKTVSDPKDMIICSGDELEMLKQRATQLKLSKILDCIDILTQTSKNIKGVSNKKILIETALVRMCAPQAANESFTPAAPAQPQPTVAAPVAPVQPATPPQPAKPAVQAEKKEEIPEKHETQTAPVTATPAAPAPAPAPVAETKKEEAAQTPAAPVAEYKLSDEVRPFDRWAEAIEDLKSNDMGLFGILIGSEAVIKGDMVIIRSPNPTLFDFIKQDSHSTALKTSLYNVTGTKLRIAVANNKQAESEKNKSPLADIKNKINNFNNNGGNS